MFITLFRVTTRRALKERRTRWAELPFGVVSEIKLYNSNYKGHCKSPCVVRRLVILTITNCAVSFNSSVTSNPLGLSEIDLSKSIVDYFQHLTFCLVCAMLNFTTQESVNELFASYLSNVDSVLRHPQKPMNACGIKGYKTV